MSHTDLGASPPLGNLKVITARAGSAEYKLISFMVPSTSRSRSQDFQSCNGEFKSPRDHHRLAQPSECASVRERMNSLAKLPPAPNRIYRGVKDQRRIR